MAKKWRWIKDGGWTFRVGFYITNPVSKNLPKSLRKAKHAYRYATSLDHLVDRIIRLGYIKYLSEISELKDGKWVNLLT